VRRRRRPGSRGRRRPRGPRPDASRRQRQRRHRRRRRRGRRRRRRGRGLLTHHDVMPVELLRHLAVAVRTSRTRRAGRTLRTGRTRRPRRTGRTGRTLRTSRPRRASRTITTGRTRRPHRTRRPRSTGRARGPRRPRHPGRPGRTRRARRTRRPGRTLSAVAARRTRSTLLNDLLRRRLVRLDAVRVQLTLRLRQPRGQRRLLSPQTVELPAAPLILIKLVPGQQQHSQPTHHEREHRRPRPPGSHQWIPFDVITAVTQAAMMTATTPATPIPRCHVHSDLRVIPFCKVSRALRISS
jgi:hypothetical protein